MKIKGNTDFFNFIFDIIHLNCQFLKDDVKDHIHHPAFRNG
jgi:hypothetical protein